MLFQWDAYLVPEAGEFFVQMTHHDRVLIVARKREVYEQLYARFEEGEWNPRERPAP
ncbi:MAG: hypothetical protein ACRDFT_04705 [bacterium]